MIMMQAKTRRPVTNSASSDVPVPIDPIATALELSMPSWPLQNVVAVSPFWNLRSQSFPDVMERLAPILRTKLYMPLAYYVEKYRVGAISEAALADALEAANGRLADVPESVDELIRLSVAETDATRRVLTFAEAVDRTLGSSWQRRIIEQVSKYAAAYFDDSQAVARFPWRNLSFWQAWRAAQQLDRAMEVHGLPGWRQVVGSLDGLSARRFIEFAADEMRVGGAHQRTRYLSRLLAAGLGWSSKFRYCQWQRSLGYDETPDADPVEYLAVLVAYDYGLAKCLAGSSATAAHLWSQSLAGIFAENNVQPHVFSLHEVWQTAFELSYQASVATQIKPPQDVAHVPRVQVVTCIDVRSEPLRRALERASSDVRTIGFAGFFGLPLDHAHLAHAGHGHRLPVLLSPAFRVDEVQDDPGAARLRAETRVRSFFRNLRKAPLASFPYVELFGCYAVGKLLRRAGEGLLAGRQAGATPRRFRPRGSLQAPQLEVQSKVERAATVLRHMGLTRDFARLVVIAGHGNASTNNAFSSALDCGACGGHAGDVNARFLADILNDPAIRAGLGARGIEIPRDTWFIAAIHETITDRIHLLGGDRVPATHAGDLERLLQDLETASRLARQERHSARSPYLDPSPERRQRNWSEVRPEWGLAGNACFIVAPREWTKGIDLGGRAFLHDYDADRDAGCETLELIMTAPMVVTNWINLQYYASTVAPEVYGAGDKTLHNLVGEWGVLEGNGGDLRVGLPLQSVHDGDTFVHEPLRLSVFIAAPRDALEMIIAKHGVVRELVDNQWLHLLHIDTQSGAVSRRLPGGLYRPLATREAP